MTLPTSCNLAVKQPSHRWHLFIHNRRLSSSSVSTDFDFLSFTLFFIHNCHCSSSSMTFCPDRAWKRAVAVVDHDLNIIKSDPVQIWTNQLYPDADDASLIFNLSLTIDLAHRTSTNLTFLRWSHPCYCKPLLTVQNCAELSRDFETWNLKRTKQKEETKFSSKFIVKKESWFSFVEVKKMIIYPQLRCGRLFIVKRHTCSNSIRRMHNVLLGVG